MLSITEKHKIGIPSIGASVANMDSGCTCGKPSKVRLKWQRTWVHGPSCAQKLIPQSLGSLRYKMRGTSIPHKPGANKFSRDF